MELIIRTAHANIIFIRIFLIIVLAFLKEAFHKREINRSLIQALQKLLCVLHDHVNPRFRVILQIIFKNLPHQDVSHRPGRAKSDLFRLL